MRLLKEKRTEKEKEKEKEIMLFERFCQITEKIKELEKEREALRKKIIDRGEGTYDLGDYVVIVEKIETLKLDPVAIYKELGLKNFLRVAAVRNEEVKAFIPSVELKNYAQEIKETFRVQVKRK